MKWPHSRREQYAKQGLPAPDVKIEVGQYLMDSLYDVGPLMPAFGDLQAISWAEVYAYQLSTGAITAPWEARAVMQMSRAYLAGFREGMSIYSLNPTDR